MPCKLRHVASSFGTALSAAFESAALQHTPAGRTARARKRRSGVDAAVPGRPHPNGRCEAIACMPTRALTLIYQIAVYTHWTGNQLQAGKE
jgi:pyruvate/2-oxoglutarate dehydrogenase complex dihydrolipoamide dehydrogenase (E3) component